MFLSGLPNAVLISSMLFTSGLVLSMNAAEDPYLWLEEVDGANALAWVRGMNAPTKAAIRAADGYQPLQDRLQAILESDQRLIVPSVRGKLLYDLWQDAEHRRGLWRRCSWADFRQGDQNWEVVLDLDALAEAEGESWVWKGASVRHPEADRAILRLSRGGGDAVVLREFDLQSKTFVQDGFKVPEAKSGVDWIDKDTLYIRTDTGPDSLTKSGYPRTVRRWSRGTALADAPIVFSAPKDHVSAWGAVWNGQGQELAYFGSSPDFFSNQVSLLQGKELVRIDKPDSASVSFFADQLLLQLREELKLGDQSFPAGSLLAFNRQAYLAGDRSSLSVLFTPTERSSLSSYTDTKSQLVIKVLDNVTSRLHVWDYQGGTWSREPIDETGVLTVHPWAVDADSSDQWLMVEHGYLQTHRLILAGPKQQREILRSSPSFFDTKGLAVTRGEATSADGTAIPWTRIAPAGAKLAPPTILYGYGGFEISLQPGYDSSLGAAWLERGGAYVVAHIRGGGEFGPRWHRAALKHQRQRAFDDFIAVGEDLLQKGLARKDALAIRGGSNGGALVGAVYTQRPDLWTAAVCQVPLLDFLRYTKLPPGASWIGEYGDPDLAEDRAVLERWSPYQQLKSGVDYPPMLLTTSTRDDRVHPGHARKFAARLNALGAPVDYLEKIEGGHGGAADRKARAELNAMVYTWLAQKLNLVTN